MDKIYTNYLTLINIIGIGVSILFLMTIDSANCDVESDFDTRNQSEFNKSSVRIDRLFGVDSSIFENYMKEVDLSVIIGIQDDDDFENYIPPEDLQRDLPTYMSGFDNQNRPIWVVEYGKYNFTKYDIAGPKQFAMLYKYLRYHSYNGIKSHALRSTPEHRVNEHFIIVDFEGFFSGHLFNSKALRLQLKWLQENRRYSDKHIAKIIAINVNPISENLLNFGRSFVIQIVKKLEVYGTNKAQWSSQLLRLFPKDQIPEWYGGSKGFKPLYVVG